MPHPRKPGSASAVRTVPESRCHVGGRAGGGIRVPGAAIGLGPGRRCGSVVLVGSVRRYAAMGTGHCHPGGNMSISFANGCEQITAADGTQLSFYDVGSGQVPVVLLHGLFGSPSNWQSIMRDLADHYRFLALQLPIEPGKERRHAAFESLGQLTDHVVRFCDEMGLESAVLCGNSLGGQVALDFYLRHPERVKRLVLSGSAGLFERSLSGGRPPRLCRSFIREQACEIFYDEAHRQRRVGGRRLRDVERS